MTTGGKSIDSSKPTLLAVIVVLLAAVATWVALADQVASNRTSIEGIQRELDSISRRLDGIDGVQKEILKELRK